MLKLKMRLALLCIPVAMLIASFIATPTTPTTHANETIATPTPTPTVPSGTCNEVHCGGFAQP